MQRLRLTEDFAIEFGNNVSHPFCTKFFNTGETAPAGNSPVHVLTYPGNDNVKLLLNSDGSVTNNVREVSCIDKNMTYRALLTLNTQMNGYEMQLPNEPTKVAIDGSYTNCLYPYPAFLTKRISYDGEDMLQYIQCKLYSIAGFKWANGIAGVYIKIYQTIRGIEYQLCNKVVLKYAEGAYGFRPIKSNVVVLDNEQFTMGLDFEILDLQYIANIDSDTMREIVRPRIFGVNDSFVFQANIDVAIGLIYDDDIHAFSASPYGQSVIFQFNEFNLRELKKAPLIIETENSLFATCNYIIASNNGNAHVEMSIKHRDMSLDSYINVQHPVDGVNIEYDVIVSPFNIDGELIDSQASHMLLSNLSSPTSTLTYIPVLTYNDNVKLRPYMCIIYVTATMTMQNDLGDLRFSRSSQVLLNEQQITQMCWLQHPQVTFNSTDIVYKKQINRTVINNVTSGNKDRVIQVRKPEYVHIKSIVLNDVQVPEQNTVTYTCPKNATYNVSLQIVDSNNDTINFNENTKFVAKSGKGIVKDALTRNSNMVEFALSNTEGKSTTWDILTLDDRFIQRIVLQS